ncbi:unnamed protein product, partial [Brassica rapa]
LRVLHHGSVNHFLSNIVFVIFLFVLKHYIQGNRSLLPQRVSFDGSLRNRSVIPLISSKSHVSSH